MLVIKWNAACSSSTVLGSRNHCLQLHVFFQACILAAPFAHARPFPCRMHVMKHGCAAWRRCPSGARKAAQMAPVAMGLLCGELKCCAHSRAQPCTSRIHPECAACSCLCGLAPTQHGVPCLRMSRPSHALQTPTTAQGGRSPIRPMKFRSLPGA